MRQNTNRKTCFIELMYFNNFLPGKIEKMNVTPMALYIVQKQLGLLKRCFSTCTQPIPTRISAYFFLQNKVMKLESA